MIKEMTLPKTKYYRKRLWKISWCAVKIGQGRFRIVKFYERRKAIGERYWELVQSAVYET